MASPRSRTPEDPTSYFLVSAAAFSIRIDSAQPTGRELASGSPFPGQLTRISATLLEIYRGAVSPAAGKTFGAVILHYPNQMTIRDAAPTSWGYNEVPAGSEWAVFVASGGGAPASAADAVSGAADGCVAIVRLDQVLPDLRLEAEAERRKLSFEQAVALGAGEAARTNGDWPIYLWDRYKTEHLGQRAPFELLLEYLERPELSERARSAAYPSVSTDLMMFQGYPKTAGLEDRFIRSFLRIAVDSPARESLAANAVAVYLPNWLGLEGALPARTAAEVFAQAPAERARIAAKLAQRPDSAAKRRLADWLAR